jgi:hypothetical protein
MRLSNSLILAPIGARARSKQVLKNTRGVGTNETPTNQGEEETPDYFSQLTERMPWRRNSTTEAMPRRVRKLSVKNLRLDLSAPAKTSEERNAAGSSAVVTCRSSVFR